MTTTTVAALPANLPAEFKEMIDDLQEIVGTEADALGTSIQISNSILEAAKTGDIEAIFAAANADTISGEDFIDVPFMLRQKDVMWRPTGEAYIKEGAFPFYTLIRTENEEGQSIVLNCGGQSVVPTVYGLWKYGALAKCGDDGLPVVLKTVKTGAGWDLLKLLPYNPNGKAKA